MECGVFGQLLVFDWGIDVENGFEGGKLICEVGCI